ncbi:MAG: PD-(D/E)XK nuclease family protein [Clostridia bacterium]|nr:PD-(D/E)XK nuclease family protein [Clostridia bacterium]
MEEKNSDIKEECMKHLLYKAIEFNKSHYLTPLKQGNLFTILDMERKEVSAHSAFLYFVFKPFEGSDGYDDLNLKELLRALLKAKGASYKNVNDYNYLDIRREVWSKFGRLDFVITADDETFVIELKIDSGEQPEQISRYREYLKEQGSDENNIFFITLDGRESETGKSVSISLKDHIFQVMQNIVAMREKEYKKYATMIEQYMELIDKITGRGKVMSNIINSTDELKSISILIDERKERMKGLIKQFFKGIINKLGEEINLEEEGSLKYPKAKLVTNASCGIKDIEEYYSERGKYYPALAFRIENTDNQLLNNRILNNGIGLFFFVESTNENGKDNFYCGISPRKAVVDEKNNITYLHNVKDFEAFENENSTDVCNWLNGDGDKRRSESLEENGLDIHFGIDKVNDKNSFIRFFNEDFNIIEESFENLCSYIRNQYKKLCTEIFALNKEV